MRPEFDERVAETVERALEVEPGKRRDLIEELCREEPGLRKEVESLLGFQQAASTFIEAPAYKLAAESLVDPDNELSAGQIVGDYQVVSLIGEGGMGEVYLAEDTKLGRRVAIKLLKGGLGTANIIRHFHQEERILADLTHPNIAQLYGSGVTPDGLPFFAMEYVDGPRLDDYCRDHRLSIPARLALFRKICSAVAYAHQRLVIHRDIKPANIRVTADGEPKLLDFGIAKLLDPETSASGEMTMTMAAVMTPEYASPEQIRGENITTTSDVYSLAVVLYKLLTGQKPYKIENRTSANIARAIAEQEPTRPSTAVARNPNPQSAIHNPKSLRGDLDNIVLMALRKEPSRRYQSVAQFSDDLRRNLEARPVLARKDTIGYRASKFVVRNKIAVSAAILVVLAIVAGLIGALWQARNARHQRDVAREERQKQEQINTFLQEMLGAAAPEAKGMEVKVSDILNEAASRAKGEAADQPAVMTDVLMTLGRTYISLGLYDDAVTNLRLAFDASLKANGEQHPTTATSMGWLGLALAFQNNVAEGERIAARAVELHRKLHPEGNESLGVALYTLGFNLIRKNEPQAAGPPLEEARALIKKYMGEKHGYYMSTLVILAHAQEKSGNIDGAESLYRSAIELGRGGEQRNKIYLAQANGYLGVLLTNKKDYTEAERSLRESEAIYLELMGENNSNVPIVQANLGQLYFRQDDYARAEIEFRKALQLLPKFFPPEYFILLSTKVTFGLTLTRLGHAAEGEPLLHEALELRKKALPKDDVLIPLTESALGECLTAQQRYDEAEPLLTGSYNTLKSKLGDEDYRTIEARDRVIKLTKPADPAP